MAERMPVLVTGDRFVTFDRHRLPLVYVIENGEPVLIATPLRPDCDQCAAGACLAHQEDL